MSTLTPHKLSEIKARADVATPGPWSTKKPETIKSGPAEGFPDGAMVAGVGRGQLIYARAERGTFPASDQDFIAASRSDIPALLALCAELLDVIEEARSLNAREMPVDAECALERYASDEWREAANALRPPQEPPR